MGDFASKSKEYARQKLSAVRSRTWGLTIVIFVSIILYILVQVGTKQRIDPIDFVFLVAIQLLLHSLYFPDGELSGSRDSTFIANKNAYNTKATEVNTNHQIGQLREYCKYEFEQRKQRYVETECGFLGITLQELGLLKQKTPKEIRHLEMWENDNKILYFDKKKRKHLYALLFDDLPVEANTPEFIMSAVEVDTNKAISDNSKLFKRKAGFRKVFMAVVFGAFLAYIGYSTKDGIIFADIVKLATYLCTMLSTAVTSFASGEVCTKVHKNAFYLNLTNFIVEFQEWATKQPK